MKLMHRYIALAGEDLSEVLVKGGVAILLRVVGAAAGFLYTIFIIRQLGVSDAGVFFVVHSLVSISAVVARFGLDHTTLLYGSKYFASGDWTMIRSLRRHTFLMTLATAAVVAVLVFAIGLGAPTIIGVDNASTLLLLSVPAILFLPASVLHAQLLRGMGRSTESVAIQSVMVPVLLLLLSLVLIPRFGLAGALSSHSIAAAVTLTFSLWLWAVHSGPQHGTQANQGSSQLVRSAGPVLQLVRSAGPMLVVTVSRLLLVRAPLLVLAHFSGPTAVSSYEVAYRTASLVSFVLIGVTSIAAPKFGHLIQNGRMADMAKLARQTSLVMTLVASPAIALLTLAPKSVLAVFGDVPSSAAPALIVLVIGESINVYTGSVTYILLMTSRERALAIVHVSALGLVLGLSTGLVPFLGVVGAAAASAAGAIAVNLAEAMLASRETGQSVVFVPWRLEPGQPQRRQPDPASE